MTMGKRARTNNKIGAAPIYEADPSFGLTAEQVESRKEAGLVNKTKKQVTKSYGRIVFDNLVNFLNIILFFLFAIMWAAGLSLSHYVFMVILIANITIGLIQDVKARLLVDKLRVSVDPRVKVIRGGKTIDLSAKEIVLSDIIELKSGDAIPADCLVLEGEIAVDESMLTGESVAIPKGKGDQILSGTYLTKGFCRARVEKVGSANYVESIQATAKQFNRPRSEIKKSISVIMVVCCVLAIVFGIMTTAIYSFPLFQTGAGFGEVFFDKNNAAYVDFVESLSGSLIAMLPAGMFLLTSLSLTVGVIALARKRVLVQQLYCIEMLARVDVLCLDKTGTLTDGTMAVADVIALNRASEMDIKKAVASVLHFTQDSNATANALKAYFGSDVSAIMQEVIPFDSELKYSAVTLMDGETYVFGAYGFVPARGSERIKRIIHSKSSEGYRCLVVGRNKKPISDKKVPNGCELLGILVLSDHIKDDAKENIEWFKSNGVDVRIISGDDPMTVSEIAKRVGVDHADQFVSLEGKSVEETARLAPYYAVFGRVNPEQKAVLVETFKKQGHKVAMTGDGVNDILALKVADCSIAMASGSDAAKNVSHLVTLDSDFSKLPDVVAQGRRVINNLQRTCSLFLTKTLFAVLLTFFFTLLNYFLGPEYHYPFSTANLIIWEIVTIGGSAFFLALQPSKDRLRGSFLKNILLKAFPAGICAVVITLIPYLLMMINPSLFCADAGNQAAVMEVTKTFAVLNFTIFSYFVLFWVCVPFNRYRISVFIAAVIAGIGVLVADGLTGGHFLLNLYWSGFNWGVFIALPLALIIVGGIYFALNYLLDMFLPKEAEVSK